MHGCIIALRQACLLLCLPAIPQMQHIRYTQKGTVGTVRRCPHMTPLKAPIPANVDGKSVGFLLAVPMKAANAPANTQLSGMVPSSALSFRERSPSSGSRPRPPQAAGSVPLKRLPPKYKWARFGKVPGVPHASGSWPAKQFHLSLRSDSVLIDGEY